ncbi:5',5'''-P-1,P-4-tetraphosphate phosphorylase 2 [Metarhizium rileyi]|uniref:5',5'''-P-1,P-4-tetraphosphate phosphorylase 2 n=1 Tax=Metarhizium rileyi (strain RCEF 4871) TaxID=1649241 RepID=A0A167JIB7_METRR|nr:5',5'''-P-1,P-4-tetraphosphate phosphorylase 2 [Metarhizium rileyi RCEF 4871]
MARALSAPSNLPSLVRTTFAKALAGGDLHYFPTKVTILPVNSVPFQLRFSPALANKPKPPQDASSTTPRKPLDPFANPPPALYIADVGPSHYLVLNKFAVVPEHFILATRDFKEQTHLLEEPDLDATLACIRAFEETRDKGDESDGLFAFFNCGEHSGASQPHRHIQLLPVDRMRDGLESGPLWNVLADREDLADTPFVVFSEPVAPAMSGAEIHGVYLRLYGQACRAVGERTGTRAEEVLAAGPTQISYNMAMTRNRLVICPRLSEGGVVCGRDGRDVGRVALNGTLLAGTALVKNEAEWDALRENPDALVAVLKGIGLSREGTCRRGECEEAVDPKSNITTRG